MNDILNCNMVKYAKLFSIQCLVRKMQETSKTTIFYKCSFASSKAMMTFAQIKVMLKVC